MAIKKIIRQKIFYFFVALLTGALVSVSLFLGLFAGWENFLEDRLYAAKPLSSKITIVAIDNESLTKLGQWPWPREIFAQALEKLNQRPPLAVGLDIVFSEPSRIGAADDKKLTQGLTQASFPLILAMEGDRLIIKQNSVAAENIIMPLADFGKGKNVYLGQVNLLVDRDGMTRRFPWKITDVNQNEYFSFAYQIVKNSGLSIPQEQKLQNINRLVFSAPAGTIRRIPFWQLLRDDSLNLENQLVFIGAMAADLHDFKNTPLGRGEQMAGVEIQANIANMLISGYRFKELNFNFLIILIFILSLLAALPFVWLSSAFRALIFNILVGLAIIMAAIVLFERQLVVNIIHLELTWTTPTIGSFVYRYLIAEKEKRQIKNIFSKYVSPKVLTEILKNPTRVALGGQEKEMTILFSDIRGFTTMSEGLQPKELIRIMNNYFSAMTEEILRHDGIIDKYIGDAIMAFWGAPLDDPNHATKALEAALAMVERLKKINLDFKAQGDPEINIGIGLYTGLAVVGNVGSNLKVNYTVLGDTVNTASRLEGQTKEYGVKIILGESTKNRAQGNYQFKSLGSTKVKGKEIPINIYTV